VQKEEYSITSYMCETYTYKKPSTFIRDKPILSSERILRDKAYGRKGSVEKISLVMNIMELGFKTN
jgi:hypothetical protein